MDVLAIYAISAGGIFVGLYLTRTLSMLANWSNFFSVLLSRHLTLPFLVHRHQLLGPWTRASVFLHSLYVATNVFLVFFRMESWAGAGRRAGKLTLINLIFPLSTIHLSYLADLLGITWHTCRKIHRATGWMAAAPNVNRDMQYLALLLVSAFYEASASMFSTYIAVIYNIVL